MVPSAAQGGRKGEGLLRTAKLAAICTSACVFFALAVPAGAAEPFYLGSWKFTAGVVAPWVDPARKPDVKERARLLGKRLVIGAKAIAGPDPFSCKGPHYAVKDYTADLLFQGAFDEMRSKNPSVDPGKIAALLGFPGSRVKTLETGCEFDFHFVDETIAEVGLNDYVYTLKKQ
jgi:hypothetical protein